MGINFKRSRIFIIFALVLAFILTACNSGGNATKEHEAVHEMNYITAEDLGEVVNTDDPDVVILDVRQTEDFNKSHH